MTWKFKLTQEDKAKWYATEVERQKFCKQNNIESNNITYFRFKVNETYYLVVTDKLLYKYFNQTKGRESSEDCRVDVVIWASKNRIQEIYQNALNGKEMNEKGKILKTN